MVRLGQSLHSCRAFASEAKHGFFLKTNTLKCSKGATTLSIMTFSKITLSIMTFSIMTLSIVTLGIMTLSIEGLLVKPSINDT
jgi:hypothetical protein